MSYGAVYGTAPPWELLGEEWEKLLDGAQLDHIKMFDAMTFDGAFRSKRDEWGDDRQRIRDDLLNRAATLISECKCKATGAILDFQFVPAKAHAAKKSHMFAWLLRKLLRVTDEESVLALMCDDDQQVAKDYYDYLNDFKRREKSLAHRIAFLCFGNDIQVPQLQAADVAAYIRGRETNPLYPLLFDKDETEHDGADLTAFLQDMAASRAQRKPRRAQ